MENLDELSELVQYNALLIEKIRLDPHNAALYSDLNFPELLRVLPSMFPTQRLRRLRVFLELYQSLQAYSVTMHTCVQYYRMKRHFVAPPPLFQHYLATRLQQFLQPFFTQQSATDSSAHMELQRFLRAHIGLKQLLHDLSFELVRNKNARDTLRLFHVVHPISLWLDLPLHNAVYQNLFQYTHTADPLTSTELFEIMRIDTLYSSGFHFTTTEHQVLSAHVRPFFLRAPEAASIEQLSRVTLFLLDSPVLGQPQLPPELRAEWTIVCSRACHGSSLQLGVDHLGFERKYGYAPPLTSDSSDFAYAIFLLEEITARTLLPRLPRSFTQAQALTESDKLALLCWFELSRSGKCNGFLPDAAFTTPLEGQQQQQKPEPQVTSNNASLRDFLRNHFRSTLQQHREALPVSQNFTPILPFMSSISFRLWLVGQASTYRADSDYQEQMNNEAQSLYIQALEFRSRMLQLPSVMETDLETRYDFMMGKSTPMDEHIGTRLLFLCRLQQYGRLVQAVHSNALHADPYQEALRNMGGHFYTSTLDWDENTRRVVAGTHDSLTAGEQNFQDIRRFSWHWREAFRAPRVDTRLFPGARGDASAQPVLDFFFRRLRAEPLGTSEWDAWMTMESAPIDAYAATVRRLLPSHVAFALESELPFDAAPAQAGRMFAPIVGGGVRGLAPASGTAAQAASRQARKTDLEYVDEWVRFRRTAGLLAINTSVHVFVGAVRVPDAYRYVLQDDYAVYVCWPYRAGDAVDRLYVSVFTSCDLTLVPARGAPAGRTSVAVSGAAAAAVAAAVAAARPSVAALPAAVAWLEQLKTQLFTDFKASVASTLVRLHVERGNETVRPVAIDRLDRIDPPAQVVQSAVDALASRITGTAAGEDRRAHKLSASEGTERFRHSVQHVLSIGGLERTLAVPFQVRVGEDLWMATLLVTHLSTQYSNANLSNVCLFGIDGIVRDTRRLSVQFAAGNVLVMDAAVMTSLRARAEQLARRLVNFGREGISLLSMLDAKFEMGGSGLRSKQSEQSCGIATCKVMDVLSCHGNLGALTDEHFRVVRPQVHAELSGGSCLV